MSADPAQGPAVSELSDDELREGLVAGAVGEPWGERAAVGLLVADGRWLSRRELRRAVKTQLGLDQELFAWVDWDQVDVDDAPATASDLGVIRLACSFGGVTGDRSLSELLAGLDSTATVHVLDAFWLACTGRSLVRRQLS